MRSHVLGWFLTLLLVTVSPRAEAFSQLYIFGDSLSDTGNLAAIRDVTFPLPFFNNRVSNGPVAVEVLAAFLGLSAEPSLHAVGPAQGTNYAIAGAKAEGDESIDLAAQVAAFLSNESATAPADALYVIFIGSNDVRDARDAEVGLAAGILSQAVSAIGTAIETLAGAGATTFLVVNAADLGQIPETLLFAQIRGTPELIENTTAYTQAFNEQLTEEVLRLQAELGLRIAEADIFHASVLLIRHAMAYGFENTTEPCFSQALRAFNPACEEGAKFDAFFFFDEIHPTAQAHAQLGGVLSAFVPIMPAPEMP